MPEIIRTGTRLRPVPLVPEIRLHQASDPISLWQRTELRVIDIASGSGLVAIAAARAGAAAVAAYDTDPLAAAAITVNADANDVTVLAVCADVLDEDGLGDTDLVLAADAFYQRDLARRVMRFLERSHTRGAAVLAGDFGRAYLPRDRLTPLASYDVSGLGVLEDSGSKRTTIWALSG